MNFVSEVAINTGVDKLQDKRHTSKWARFTALAAWKQTQWSAVGVARRSSCHRRLRQAAFGEQSPEWRLPANLGLRSTATVDTSVGALFMAFDDVLLGLHRS